MSGIAYLWTVSHAHSIYLAPGGVARGASARLPGTPAWHKVHGCYKVYGSLRDDRDYGIGCRGRDRQRGTVQRADRFCGFACTDASVGCGYRVHCSAVWQMAGRNRRLRETPPMPTQEQELLLQEEGWASASAGELPPAPMRSWKELEEQRTGRRTLILVGPGDGPDRRFAAVPLRVLSTAQGGHLHRLVTRKLRPSF